MQGHRVVDHRHAAGLEHLAEDHAQRAGPRPLLQVVDRLVAQEQRIEVVHDDPFGVALLDPLHEAREGVAVRRTCARRARATNCPSLLPSSRSPTPTYQASCPPWRAARASRVVVYSSTSVATSLTTNASPHAATSPSYRSVTDAPARSRSRRSCAPGTSSQRGRTHGLVRAPRGRAGPGPAGCGPGRACRRGAASRLLPSASGVEDAGDPAQVDRVLHRAAADDDPDGDGPRGPRRDRVVGAQRLEDVQEAGAVEHLADGDDPRREHPQASRVQPAGQVLGEHGEALLGLVVAGQADGQQRQGLPGAVLVGDDVGADLVVQQRLDPVRPEGGGLGDEQPAERHHQLGDVVAHLDAAPGSPGTRRGSGRTPARAASANAPAVTVWVLGPAAGWSRAAPPRPARGARRPRRRAAATRTRTVTCRGPPGR